MLWGAFTVASCWNGAGTEFSNCWNRADLLSANTRSSSPTTTSLPSELLGTESSAARDALGIAAFRGM
jgi:hypothetical protein